MEALKLRIDAMVTKIGELIDAHWKAHNFSQEKPTHRADYISDKWCRIVVIENGTVRSVYGFVCLQDYETKTLGKLKAGDIHKAAGFKVPAKTARGSVFAEDFNNCLTAYGIVYLK
jgi:hypothetical protein